MRLAPWNFARRLLAALGSVAVSLSATCVDAADPGVVRLPSVLDAPEHAATADPLLFRGQRSYRLVQFDDPADHQISPSDIRRPGVSRTVLPAVQPIPDEVTSESDYVGEWVTPYCDDFGNWLQNTECLLGGDTYKAIGDSTGAGSLNNSFGARAAFNTGIGLGSHPVRFQFGAAYGVYDFFGRPDPAFDTVLEEQIHVTGGFYKRSDVCCGSPWSWGLVLDKFFGQYWGNDPQTFDLTQVRGVVGYAVSECDEFGAWTTVSVDDDVYATVSSQGQRTTIQAMDQFNVYWKHNWSAGADTVLYAGMIDNADLGDWVCGGTARAPLNSHFALLGAFTYCGPHSGTGALGVSEEAWNVLFGFAYYPGGKAISENVSGQRGLPLIPVANNGSFLITP